MGSLWVPHPLKACKVDELVTLNCPQICECVILSVCQPCDELVMNRLQPLRDPARMSGDRQSMTDDR